MKKEITICDKCEKEIEGDMINIRGLTAISDTLWEYDICEECSKDFRKMFNEFQEKKEDKFKNTKEEMEKNGIV